MISSYSASGQFIKYDFDKYNSKDGLSQNNVVCIAQDKKGFMWFGTQDGLNRFDGHEFRVFKQKENDPHSIISNNITCLMVDEEDGAIWIGTNNGLCRYLPETEFIEHFPIDFTDSTKVNGAHVSSIMKNKDDNIWISYIGGGIDILRPGQAEIFHYTIHRNDEYKLRNDHITTMAFMPDGYILIGSFDGIQAISNQGLVLSAESAKVKYPWISEVKNAVNKIVLTRNKRYLWIGTETSGAFVVNMQTQQFHNFNRTNSELESSNVISIKEDSESKIWIGGDAIYYYDPQKNNLIRYNDNSLYIKGHTNAIFEDKNNNLWIGTARLGVLKTNPKDTKILHYHSNQGEGSLKSDEILSFNQDDKGNIWIGTGGAGLVKMKPDQKGFEDAPVLSEFLSHTIKCMYKDKEGYFWMGTWEGGLIKYHPITNALEQFHPSLNNFGSHHVWSIQGDKQGNLWLGTLRDGLCYFNTQTKEYKYFTYRPSDPTALANNDVQCVFLDSRDILWVGTANGISVMLPGSEHFVNKFKVKANSDNSLPSNSILTINEDKNGKIWLGTNGGGITILDVKNSGIIVEKILKEPDGLPSNNITSIENDLHKFIWVSSYNGLAKLDPDSYSVQELSQVASLKGAEFLGQSSFRVKDGRLFFGGVYGFHTFHPDSLSLTENEVEVHFTSLKIFTEEITPHKLYKGRRILEKSLTSLKELKLSYEDYSFTINFAPLLYNGQNSLRYSYYLENLDKTWQYTSSDRRFVHYSNLSPGTYILKVKASFDGENWPEEAKELRIIISPPWWGTVWFKVFIVFMTGAFFFSIYYIRVRFLKSQSRKLEDLVTVRTSELKKSNIEIQKLLHEIATQKYKVVIQNEALQEVNEELSAQRDSLEQKGKELLNAQNKLKEINASLESLVEKRTKTLNDTLHELETFLYRASHDLQGPISTMKGLLSLTSIENNAGIDNNKYAELHQQAILKLERALKNLMQKHVIQNARITYELFDKKSLLALLKEITEELKHFRSSDLKMFIDEDIAFNSDKTLLALVLGNLLENSFLYSQRAENKKVILTFRKFNSKIKITVEDYGCGIKEDIRKKIFTMFYRGSELSDGNGLGLYLVKNALDKLEGSISIESEENAFTRFSVILESRIKDPANPINLDSISLL